MGRRILFKLNRAIFFDTTGTANERSAALAVPQPTLHGRKNCNLFSYGIKASITRSFLSAGARLLSYPSPSVVAQHSKTPFRPTLPFVLLFTSDKVTFLKEASVEPTPSTPGAICQPGIIRFPRSFNEINNDGGKARRSNGKRRKGRIISTATREDTTEDSLLFSRQGAFLIYSLAPFTSEKWIQSRESLDICPYETFLLISLRS